MFWIIKSLGKNPRKGGNPATDKVLMIKVSLIIKLNLWSEISLTNLILNKEKNIIRITSIKE
jgi:hypothetical protein